MSDTARTIPAPCDRKCRRAAWLAPLCLWTVGTATAQDASPDPTSSAPAEGDESIAVGDDREIVVTARFGEALVEPETELDEQQIDAFGAYSIGELVRRIAPLTGRPDEPPILLINGERVDSIGDLSGFPPAALRRLAILPPEAAARYGYSSNQRVVNLVLKRHFISWELHVGVKRPTAGGRTGGNGSAGRFVIDGKARWSAQVQLASESALLKSARTSSQQQVDARLDPDAYRSLLPATTQMSATIGLTRPVGSFTGSFNMNLDRNSSRQWLGLAPASPNATDTIALTGRQSAQNLGLSATFSGRLAGGRAIFSANYAHGWTKGRIDQPDDAAPQRFRTNRNRSTSDALAARLTYNRPVAKLPAGPIAATLTAAVNRNRTTSRLDPARPGGTRTDQAGQDRFDGRLSLAVPISSRSPNSPSWLGDLSFDIAGGLSVGSREALRPRLELGASWSPLPAFRLHGAFSVARLAPSAEQLTAPYVEEVRRIYDLTRQEIAEPVWVTGGNPDLRSGHRRTWSLGINLRPFDPRLLSLSTEYQRQRSTGGVGGFPGLTPAIEAALPDRFVRDAAGRLIRIDARPIRIASDTTERLNNSLTLILAPRARAKDSAADTVAAANPWTFALTLNHGWNLRSELVTIAGMPPLDRLRGGTAQSRHNVGLQIMAGRPGIGATLDGNWQSAFRLRAPGGGGDARDYRYKAAMTLKLRLSVEPGRLLGQGPEPDWLSGLNVTLDIQNLLNDYRRVTLADGSAAPGYERYEADPLGRTIQLSLRKRF